MEKKYIVNNENKPYLFPTVLECFRKLPVWKQFSYQDYSQEKIVPLLERVIFNNQFPINTKHKTFLTNGAKNGFVATVSQFSKKYDTVLIPAPMWPGYKRVCHGLKRKIVPFPIVDETGRFNCNELKDKFQKLARLQQTVILVLNTPCHNPTGYTLNALEIRELIRFINKMAYEYKTRCILYIDMVCMDFEPNFLGNYHIFDELNKMNRNILVLVQYSMSKALGLFGTGIGSLTGITKDTMLYEEFYDKIKLFVSSLVSNTNSVASEIFWKIYSNKEKEAQLKLEQEFLAIELKQRAGIFTEEAKRCNLPLFPYHSGWRICIYCKNADSVNEKLHRSEVYSFKQGLAVSLYQLPQYEIVPLVRKIKVIMEKES